MNKAIDTSKLNYGAYTFSLYAEDSSGTYTLIKADVPEFFRRLKIVIIYKKYLYVYDDYREKQFEKADYEC